MKAISSTFALVLILGFALIGSCSSGHSSKQGDNDGCPDGYLLGADGKCHAIDGDTDKDTAESEVSDTLDGDPDIDRDKDDLLDGDLEREVEIEQDTDSDPDPEPDLEPEKVETEKEVEMADPEPDKVEVEKEMEYEFVDQMTDCQVDETCGYGWYCSTSKKCTFNCRPESAAFDCMGSTACCDETRGRCIACGGDPDEGDKVDLEHCTSDAGCPLTDFCDTSSGYCETDCGPTKPCANGWECKGTGVNNDHPQCTPPGGKRR